MSAPVICVSDVTDPLFGPPGTVMSGAMTVFAGPSKRAVALMGSLVTPHGNPAIPVAPGFNPICASATILTGSSTIMVENQPLAKLDQGMCSCGLHQIIATGEPTVTVGP